MALTEFKTKVGRLREFLGRKGLGAVLLSSRANFSWLACGRTNQVRSDSEKGVAALWVTRKGVELWCDSIEEKRFKEEEARGLPLVYRVHPWTGGPPASFSKAGSDNGAYGLPDRGGEIARLRWSLLPKEISRYRKVGKLSGLALEAVGKRARRGWTERRVAAELSFELVSRGLEPSVILVGSDERLKRHRHPLPTDHPIKKSVMMVVCAKGHGLIASLTRLVHFGPVPAELRRRHAACLQVECALWESSRPGAPVRDVFKALVREYGRQGFPGEWKLHHQGGPTGYDTRDYLATPDCPHRLVENQALAWNPSITGTKSEDTVLLTAGGLEVLTPTPGWPLLKVRHGGREYRRPDIQARK